MAGASVVDTLQMPGVVDAVEIDERQPAVSGDLEVVARDRPPPPGLLDPPLVADLDDLAPAVPADRPEIAGRIQLHLDRRERAQQPGHGATTGRQVQRASDNGASGSMRSTRRTRSSPYVRASRASCHSSRA